MFVRQAWFVFPFHCFDLTNFVSSLCQQGDRCVCAYTLYIGVYAYSITLTYVRLMVIVFVGSIFTCLWLAMIVRPTSATPQDMPTLTVCCIYMLHSIPVYYAHIESRVTTLHSLVPRPPPFFVFWFSFSIIHGSGRAQKTGKAWEHLSRE